MLRDADTIMCRDLYFVSPDAMPRPARAAPRDAATAAAADMKVVGGVPPRWYARRTATSKPRIQVTVDDELAQALARIDPAPASKAALVRDLALRGAQAVEEERARRDEAIQVLLEIADGTLDYDFAGCQEILRRVAANT